MQSLRLLPVARLLSRLASVPPCRKPKVLVTRLLPEKPLDVLREHCAVDLYDKHDPMPRELLIDKVGKVDAVICLLTDPMDRGVIEKCYSVRAICDVSVGYNNVDIAAARERADLGDAHARRADRGDRQPDLGADPRRDAARRRRRSADPPRRLDRVPLRLPARQRSLRQAARHHRHGPHRPGRGPPRAGLRHGDRLPAERAQAQAADVALRGRPARDADAVRRADADVGRDRAALPADAGDASPDRRRGRCR